MAAPSTPIFNGKIKSQSRKIFAAAPAHIPANESAGEPSFLTKTERQLLINIGTENAE